MEIIVAGEALIDVIIDHAGTVSAWPGGGPFNVARTVARLGGDCQFLGRMGDDAFGRRLRVALEHSGVRLPIPDPVPQPTTLAVAELDREGSAEYHFYLEGTAAGQLRPEDLSTVRMGSVGAIALGGLSLLMEPMRSALRTLLAEAAPEVTVMLDPNGRPQALGPGSSFAGALEPFLPRADVVKVSTDDLRLLAPEAEPLSTARGLLGRPPDPVRDGRPSAVLITDGPGAVTVLTAGGGSAEVAVPEVEVVDTVGAGDAFVAGFLTWWVRGGHGRGELADSRLLLEATRAAVRVAAAACTVSGAGLPEGFRWEG